MPLLQGAIPLNCALIRHSEARTHSGNHVWLRETTKHDDKFMEQVLLHLIHPDTS
jgi:hypothetical protein